MLPLEGVFDVGSLEQPLRRRSAEGEAMPRLRCRWPRGRLRCRARAQPLLPAPPARLGLVGTTSSGATCAPHPRIEILSALPSGGSDHVERCRGLWSLPACEGATANADVGWPPRQPRIPRWRALPRLPCSSSASRTISLKRPGPRAQRRHVPDFQEKPASVPCRYTAFPMTSIYGPELWDMDGR